MVLLLLALVVIGLWPRLMTDDLEKSLEANFDFIQPVGKTLVLEDEDGFREMANTTQPISE